MSEELFPAESIAMLSPKLAWLKAHGAVTSCDPRFDGTEDSPETGDTLLPWACLIPFQEPTSSFKMAGVGMTEEDAIIDFCRKNDLKHWRATQMEFGA